MTSARELLTEARELVEKHFTTDTLARDAAGRPCPPNAGDARCFCAIGALCHVAGARGYIDLIEGRAIHPDEGRRAMLLLDQASMLSRGGQFPSPASVNDDQGLPGVLRMFDVALGLAGLD